MVGTDRELRAARNENVFRQLNERLLALSRPATGVEELERFVCECEHEACSLVVELSPSEYRDVRADGRRFLVFPEPWHTSPELEAVVARYDRYWVVEKTGGAGAKADDLADEDPAPL